MRIVGGKFGGRRLKTSIGKGTRPTAERVREGLTSALISRGCLEDRIVLDLFCGTGALAFEALSRGAAHATLIDRDRKLCKVVQQCAAELGVQSQVNIQAADLTSATGKWVQSLKRVVDLVFIDPPYKEIALVPVVLLALQEGGKLGPDAMIVIEHSRGLPPELPANFKEITRYRYGDTGIVLAQPVADLRETQ